MKNMNMKLFSIIMLVLVALVVGCTDRGTNKPAEMVYEEGGISPQNHVFYNELLFQINNEFQLSQMAVYVPKVSFPAVNGGELKPVPLLILLAPEDGDRYYYFNHGLKKIADELISNGTIEPMVIACIGNNTTFGGFFWGGHYPNGGDYDAMIGSALVDYLEYAYPYVIADPTKRAIGGFGQGAYGALRAAILNPDEFSSVSVVDGPLDFDGVGGVGGMQELFDDALNEQGLLNGDLTAFDSSGAWPLSKMFIGGSYAFSPYDTLYTYEFDVDINANVITEIYSIDNDSTTLVSSLVARIGQRSVGDIHLPFTSDGQIYAPIWDNFWVPNNLENMLTPGVLSGVNLWVGTSVEATFANYHQQTASFIDRLDDEYNVEVFNYSGYEGKPASNGEYVYDLLKEILIFNSEKFQD